MTSQKLVVSEALRPAPLTPLLASQTMPDSRAIAPGFDQRPDRQVCGGRIAAGIRNQPRAGNAGTAKLRQSVDGLGEQSGLRMRGFVPALVVLRRAQPEGAAQVDDLDAGIEQARRHFHGNLRRSRQKHGFEARGLGFFRPEFNAARPYVAERTRTLVGVTML